MAATFHLAASPAMVGIGPGADGFMGTADDVSLQAEHGAALNTPGALSSFVVDSGVSFPQSLGFITGSFELGTPGQQLVLGTNAITAVSYTTEVSYFDTNGQPADNGFGTPLLNVPGQFSLSPPGTGTLFSIPVPGLGSAEFISLFMNYAVNDDLFTGRYSFGTGNAALFQPTDDWELIIKSYLEGTAFSGDIPKYTSLFNTLDASIPANWTVMGFTEFSFVFDDFPDFRGHGVTAFYSTDPLAVPVPAAVPLPASALLMIPSLYVLARRRRHTKT